MINKHSFIDAYVTCQAANRPTSPIAKYILPQYVALS